MKWDCICFDLDNTLCDYEHAFEMGMRANYVLFSRTDWEEKNLPPVNEWFPVYKSLCDSYWKRVEDKSFSKREYQRRRLVDSLERFGVSISTESADRFQRVFYETVDKYVCLYEGVPELLDALTSQGIKLGIISNGGLVTQQRKIEKLKLFYWFSPECMIISEKVAVAKPSIEIFQHAEDKLGAQRMKKLFVGDSWELDVLGALHAGWDALYVNTRGEVHKTSDEPFAVCETINEAKRIILN